MTSQMIHVHLNGVELAVAPGTTLVAVVATATALTTGIAVALNGTVVPRSAWGAQLLVDRDSVDIVTAKQGG